MNKIFATVSSLLIAMGIKGQVPVKKEVSKAPATQANTISPKTVYPKVEHKVDHKDGNKVIPTVEHKVDHKVSSKVVTPKVEHKLEHKDAGKTVIPKVEHKVDHKTTAIPKVEHKISNK